MWIRLDVEDEVEGGGGREGPNGDFYFIRENRRHQVEEEREGNEEGDEETRKGEAGEGEEGKEGEGEGEGA